MKPVAFPQSNRALGKPANMSADECDPLAIYSGKTAEGMPVMISCFKLTEEELEEFNRTKRIWLWIYGTQHPPVILSAKNPFE